MGGGPWLTRVNALKTTGEGMTRESMYGIDYVAGLPGGRDFMFIDLEGDGALIYYRRDALTPSNLEDSWAAFRACQGDPPIDDVATVVPIAQYVERDGLVYATR